MTRELSLLGIGAVKSKLISFLTVQYLGKISLQGNTSIQIP